MKKITSAEVIFAAIFCAAAGLYIFSYGWVVLAQQIINGIQKGSMYALIALGYTLVYGIIKLINFAHGDVFSADDREVICGESGAFGHLLSAGGFSSRRDGISPPIPDLQEPVLKAYLR